MSSATLKEYLDFDWKTIECELDPVKYLQLQMTLYMTFISRKLVNNLWQISAASTMTVWGSQGKS